MFEEINVFHKFLETLDAETSLVYCDGSSDSETQAAGCGVVFFNRKDDQKLIPFRMKLGKGYIVFFLLCIKFKNSEKSENKK